MVKHFLVILFSAFCLSAAAQQGLVMDFGEIDSTEMQMHRNLEYQQFLNGTFQSDYFLEEIKLPEFNTQYEYQQRYTVSLNVLPLNNYSIGGFSPGSFGGFSPLFYNGEILSEAAYSLGDKLVVGGFSYGANSVMSAPAPNINGSYFDTYGSTMFMQYKVSKNFKIETRVSVGQSRGVGF